MSQGNPPTLQGKIRRGGFRLRKFVGISAVPLGNKGGFWGLLVAKGRLLLLIRVILKFWAGTKDMKWLLPPRLSPRGAGLSLALPAVRILFKNVMDPVLDGFMSSLLLC